MFDIIIIVIIIIVYLFYFDFWLWYIIHFLGHSLIISWLVSWFIRCLDGWELIVWLCAVVPRWLVIVNEVAAVRLAVVEVSFCLMSCDCRMVSYLDQHVFSRSSWVEKYKFFDGKIWKKTFSKMIDSGSHATLTA